MSYAILTLPRVAFAAAYDRLRRLPGGSWVDRQAVWVVLALLAGAALALVVWGAQRSPQRTSMADLTAGNLSSMQTWIIISGDLAAGSTTGGFHYTLTDPNVPGARLLVSSDVELATGRTTISGRLIGSVVRRQGDFAWVAQLNADPELAREADPPWIAIALTFAALLLGLGHRTVYPVFFTTSARPQAAQGIRLAVHVRRDWPSDAAPVRAELAWQPGSWVELSPAEGERVSLRPHSAHSSVNVGELRTLGEVEPALIARLSSGDFALTFATAEQRDAAYAALMADLPTRPSNVGPTGQAHGGLL